MQVLSKYKKYITLLQIVQLISAVVVSPYFYYIPVETVFNYMIIILFNIYIYVLIFLFIKFSYSNYILKNNISTNIPKNNILKKDN